MKLHKLTCTNCNGILDMNIDDGTTSVFCPYCGQKFLIDDETRKVTINKNININKTIHNRYTDDADVIRAKNEERIESLRSDTKIAILGFKLIGLIMIILFALVIVHVIRDAIEVGSRKEPYIATLSSSFDYKWDNYIEVVEDLENAGFKDITTVDLNDASLFQKEDTVSKVTINGEESFSKNQEFPESSEIIVYYH